MAGRLTTLLLPLLEATAVSTVENLLNFLFTQHVDLLARGTVESSRNPRVQELLEYLKDR